MSSETGVVGALTAMSPVAERQVGGDVSVGRDGQSSRGVGDEHRVRGQAGHLTPDSARDHEQLAAVRVQRTELVTGQAGVGHVARLDVDRTGEAHDGEVLSTRQPRRIAPVVPARRSPPTLDEVVRKELGEAVVGTRPDEVIPVAGKRKRLREGQHERIRATLNEHRFKLRVPRYANTGLTIQQKFIHSHLRV